MTFLDFKLNEKINKALNDCNYTTPSLIQEQSIPLLLENNDVLGCAQTGTGKTCAFMIPLIQKILSSAKSDGKIKGLIITPTRELAIQIYDNTKKYCKYTNVKSLAIYGGVKEGLQKQGIQKGVDILIATPGRLLDFIRNKIVDLSNVAYFVLDEADRMLDMGFIKDVYKILEVIPSKRQTLLFSATMPADIRKLAENMLHNPKYVTIASDLTPVSKITQYLYYVDKKSKGKLLADVLKSKNIYRAIVFVRTKRGADKLTKELKSYDILSMAIHGEKSQGAREKALREFKLGNIQALVATDIAARGIDIQDLDVVINFDLPDVPETYTHRIGRTARAGKSGEAITFSSVEEIDKLNAVKEKCHVKFNLLTHDKYSLSETLFPEKEIKQQGRSRGSFKTKKTSNVSLPPNHSRNRKNTHNKYGKKIS